jgi:regulator of protease activity HflC (stomatin/prohibitin superfamily)
VAEGQRQAVELQAAADAARVKLEADAKAYAINQVSEALATKGGVQAMEYNLASNYLESLVEVLPNSKMNTIFLPQDLGDLPKMMATAKGVLHSDPEEAAKVLKKISSGLVAKKS